MRDKDTHLIEEQYNTILEQEDSVVVVTNQDEWDNLDKQSGKTVHIESKEGITIQDNGNLKVIINVNKYWVDVYNNSFIIAENESHVLLRNNSTVFAKDNAVISAWDNSTVFAEDNVEVLAHDNSYIDATDNVQIHASDNVKIDLSGNAIIVGDSRGLFD